MHLLSARPRPSRITFAVLALVAALLAVAGPAAAADGCDITGTPGDDVLTGTDADEVICGLGGDDVIRGARGHDVLIGGDGNDILIGGPGNDELIGGAGDDVLTGRTGRDRIVGQAGNDRLEGSNGRDRLIGGGGIDHCTDRRGVTKTRGCEIGEGGVSPELHAARELWSSYGVNEFVYALSEAPGCVNAEPACVPPQFAPVTVLVRDGEATAEVDVVSPRTADQLFDEAVAAERAGGDVAFDAEVGLPVSIETDASIISVSDIQLRDGVRARLEAARASWSGAVLTDYSFTFRQVCFCPNVADVRVTVEGGEVASAAFVDETIEGDVPTAYPVDWHLDQIEELLDGHNRSVTASFDRRVGFPVSYSVDRSALIADEEITVEIFDFDDPNALQLVEVGGIVVNATIAEPVEVLLAAAADDGFIFAGGGYRDPARQIELRKVNCGTSDYAIWDMPASQCSPPTARPGQSMHEQGLAIDFTSSGRLVTSRSEAAFVWLEANAPAFGFLNHPAEPWHWSTNGN